MKDVIEQARELSVGNPCNLVNWDIFNNIPDLYEPKVSKVEFRKPGDVKKKDFGDFYPTRDENSFMPIPALMDRIAEVKGICGLDEDKPEQIIGLIDWSRMICSFDAPPQMIKYPVGWSCTKRGEVLMFDGRMRPSAAVTVMYNAWERCVVLWSKEEEQTDFYKNIIMQNGKKTYNVSYGNQTYNYECKYDTRGKRQKHFDDEMLFAQRKADTKAREGVIRNLCGMPTGFKLKDLETGAFYVSKVERSQTSIKAEYAARLDAILHGIGDNSASRALYGPSDETPVIRQAEQYTEPEPVEPVQAARVINREFVIRALSQYKKAGLIADTVIPTCDSLTAWLANTPDAETQTDYWNKTVAMLNGIEEKIPEGLRCQ